MVGCGLLGIAWRWGVYVGLDTVRSSAKGGEGRAFGYYCGCDCIESREIHGLDRVSHIWVNWDVGLSIYCGSSCKCSNKIRGIAPE